MRGTAGSAVVVQFLEYDGRAEPHCGCAAAALIESHTSVLSAASWAAVMALSSRLLLHVEASPLHLKIGSLI